MLLLVLVWLITIKYQCLEFFTHFTWQTHTRWCKLEVIRIQVALVNLNLTMMLCKIRLWEVDLRSEKKCPLLPVAYTFFCPWVIFAYKRFFVHKFRLFVHKHTRHINIAMTFMGLVIIGRPCMNIHSRHTLDEDILIRSLFGFSLWCTFKHVIRWWWWWW